MSLLVAMIATVQAQTKPVKGYPYASSLASYKTVKLTTDLSGLTVLEKEVLKRMILAAKQADAIFWMQAWGDKDALLKGIENDTLRKFVELNYGPWDRLNNDSAFIEGVGAKPKGAGFYPKDMTEAEFKALLDPEKNSQYTIVERGTNGKLQVVKYAEAYQQQIDLMCAELRQAAMFAGRFSPELAVYLDLRTVSLRTADYHLSDSLWLKLRNSNLDIIIGPIENYEDKLYGKKTAFEAYVLVRDKDWSNKLEKYIAFLPELQSGLPVEAKYKTENPGNSGSQLAVFDVVYYAGDCNAGSKTIAVNLPNDEGLQQSHGTRRSQLKNVMNAKYEHIVVPIAKTLIDPSQQGNVKWECFFSNVMFHEVAHGLGIKNTVTGKGLVREALGATYSAIEECKADVLGLYMVTKLQEKGELGDAKLQDYYVTFVASVFRSVRFGASSAHGKANMITFNHLMEQGAVSRNAAGQYLVNVEKMKKAIEQLAGMLIMWQGDGDIAKVQAVLNERGVIPAELKSDLEILKNKQIPLDIQFEQGLEELGLN